MHYAVSKLVNAPFWYRKAEREIASIDNILQVYLERGFNAVFDYLSSKL